MKKRDWNKFESAVGAWRRLELGSLAAEPIGPGGPGRATARPLFAPCGPALSPARPLFVRKLRFFPKLNVMIYRKYYSFPPETDAQATTTTIPSSSNRSPHIAGS